MKSLTVFVAGFLFLQTAHAQLFVDPFSYGTGNLGTVGSSGGWTNSNVGVTVSSDSLDGTALGLPASSGNKVTTTTASASGTYNQFSTGIKNGSVYYSFLLRVHSTSGLTSSGQIISGFLKYSSQSSYYDDVWLRLNGSNVEIGLSKLRAGTTWRSTPLVVGVTYLIVVKYQFVSNSNNDVVSLWVNPATGGSEPTPDISFSNGGDGNDSTGIGRCYIYGGASVDLDEVRIGTSWEDVAPSGGPLPPAAVPSITETLLAPEGFVLRGTGGATNGIYYVITSTDIGASLSNWFCIATNQFDASGNFECTFPISPFDSQRFYRVWYGSPGPVNPVTPSISTQPQDQSVVQGQTANFNVVASGTAPLTYQWYYDSSIPISGATNATLTLGNVQPGNAGDYSVVVANSAGSATSIVATLTVNIPVPPSISIQPQDLTVGEGETVEFDVAASGTAPLIYQWYFNSTTPVGDGTSTLTLSNVTTSDAGGYSVVIDNSYGSITSVVATLTVTNIVAPPSITTQPQNQTVTEGQGVVFSVSASGTPPLSYQWYFNTNTPLASATNSTLGLSNVSSNNAGGYSVAVANSYGSVTSIVALLTVNPAPTNGGPVQILQAEDATFTGTVANNHSGYTGTGFVDTENAVGSYIEWEFGRQQAGTETFYVRYAHGKTDSRPASVMVNGATVTSSLAFPPTGDFTNWQYVTNTIPVVAGRNILRLTALNSGGLVNVDRIEITGNPQYKLSTSVIGRGIISLSPSNAFNYYNPGAVVQLTGVPLTGAVFTAWSGAVTSSNNPETVAVNGNISVTAEFYAYLHFPLYVSPTGSDSNPGTIDEPFYSLQKAVDAAIPGDTIYMRGGTFTYSATVTIAKPATSNSPISIVAYTGERPILDYSTWHPANETIRSGARGIHITTNAQYWVLQGLEIQYAPDNGIKSEGGHITFDQCVFHHNGDSGLQIGLNKDTFSTNPNPDYWAAYNTVINCDSYRNADPATSYENADGFACKLYAGKGNHFYGCRAWENVDDGWDCYQTEYEIVIDNCWSWHNGDPTLWGFSSFNGDGNGFKLGGDNTFCPILVRNCIALNCQWGTTVGFAFNNNTAPLTFYNCSALNCGRPYKLDQAGNILKNCLDYNGTRPAPKDISSSSIQQNNSWQLPVTVTAADFISISETDAVAPRQADGSLPNNGFGRLVAGSDLIDKGVDVGLPYCVPAPDLGAYEYCP
jgi:6,7-dimethyl-8-ribityllumazine synthase